MAGLLDTSSGGLVLPGLTPRWERQAGGRVHVQPASQHLRFPVVTRAMMRLREGQRTARSQDVAQCADSRPRIADCSPAYVPLRDVLGKAESPALPDD